MGERQVSLPVGERGRGRDLLPAVADQVLGLGLVRCERVGNGLRDHQGWIRIRLRLLGGLPDCGDLLFVQPVTRLAEPVLEPVQLGIRLPEDRGAG